MAVVRSVVRPAVREALRGESTAVPTVSISKISGGSCTYEPPGTTDCDAQGTYQANDSGFDNAVTAWLWTVESGAATIVGADDEQTVVVETANSDEDVAFVLKVVASNVDPQSAEKEQEFTHLHVDDNEAPAFVGPVSNLELTEDEAMTPVDFAPLFTGTNLEFTSEGTALPAGLSLSSAGELTGTPTTEATTTGVVIRATNSQGDADSDEFEIDVVASEADSLLTDLVAWYSLDEESGTRVNAHNPGTHDLTDNNTVGYGTGKQGNAASFAGGGNDESLTLANHSDFEFADTPFTVAMWVRPETGIESNAYVIGVGAPATVWTIMRNGGAGSISFRVRNAANTSTAATAGIAYSLGTWALYIAEHDPDADEIRLSSNNGTPVSAALAGGGRITGTDAFIIGSNLGAEFVGLLDETAIWRRLLTSDEKARLYNSGAGMGYPG